MYCCRCYNFYGEMKYAKKKDCIQAYSAQQIKEKEQQERQAQIEAIEREIHKIEIQLDQYQEISLLGVEVTQAKFGKGIVIDQAGSRIKVQFAQKEVSYIINRKYQMRPRFEDDEDIVEAFTVYDELLQKKQKLEKKRMFL